MKNHITAVAAAVLAVSSFNVMAAQGDVIGGGNIQFNGTVNADTCYVESTTGDAKTIVVPMGTVNTAQLQNSTLATPAMPQGVDQGGATFNITCSAATGVEMKFAAASSQIETGNKILKINNGSNGPALASGIGIAVYPDRTNTTAATAYDLTNGVLFSDTLTAGQKVQLQFAAAYVKTAGPIKAGTANATLPFTIITP